MFEASMKSYFKSKELDYDVTVGSILHDEGVQPHIQAPHLDFDPKSLKRCNQMVHKKPVVVLYAIEEFSIVLYLRHRGEFGETVGTRFRVPKGCAIIMAGDLYHSGDIFLDSNNLRFHAYCIPTNITFPLFQVNTTYRDGYPQLCKVKMHYVENMGCHYGNDVTMMERLREIFDIRTTNETERKEYVVLLLLSLYNYIQLSPTINAPDTIGGACITKFWVGQMYRVLVDECMKAINSEGINKCRWIDD